jgi:2-amino-4-hydroxy-6-hydroxymethyldihydropteridine diphosphokinase
MPLAALGLGANLPSRVGAPATTLAAAVAKLQSLGQVTARSSLYRTVPVGYAQQPDFLNAAVLLETELPARELLSALLQIERSFGRDRTQGVPNGPRTLDLDLLLLDKLILHEPALQLPHPAMHERRFVLAPLAEIAPEWVHPVLHRTMAELLAALPPNAGAVTRSGALDDITDGVTRIEE